MDLYYSYSREDYTACSNTYPKDVLKTLHKMMKSYYFLSKHPKHEVKFPTHGSKPPPKHPNSIRMSNLPGANENADFSVGQSTNTFIREPRRKEHPAGSEQS
jgi:hypothetical protein